MSFIYFLEMESESSSGDEYIPDPDIEYSPEHSDTDEADEEAIEVELMDAIEEDADVGSDSNSPAEPEAMGEAAEGFDVNEVYDVSAAVRSVLQGNGPAHSSTAVPSTTTDVGEESKVETAQPPKDSPIRSSQKRSNADASLDDDGQTCTICFEPWTNTSEHRLVSLRCGHLFGRSCITRWLKGQNARCPQCNARARKSEIRNIYAKTVKAIDSTERDRALQDLQKESEKRRKAEMETAQERLKCMMKTQECEELRKRLMEAQELLKEYRTNRKFEKTQQASSKPPSFYLEKCIEITKNGTCRIMDVNDMLNMILVTQQSTTQMFPGFGFRKISTLDMKPSEFVLVHSKVIKDIAFHPYDAMVLTASLDKSVKITNALTNSVVHSYPLESDVWSCAWDADNPVYFYAGTKASDVLLYDIRVTGRHVQELPRFGFRTPVLSLQYIKRTAHFSQNKCGLVVGKLSDCGFYQKCSEDGQHKSYPFPTVGPLSSLSSMRPTGQFLISCRPSNSQPRLTHTLCELVTAPSEGGIHYNPIQVVQGGRSQVQLTRSKLLDHPTDPTSLLICAGDEDSHGALIWDGSSGKPLDHLKSDSCVLDFADTKINNKSVLMALTDNSLRLYSWGSQS